MRVSWGKNPKSQVWAPNDDHLEDNARWVLRGTQPSTQTLGEFSPCTLQFIRPRVGRFCVHSDEHTNVAGATLVTGSYQLAGVQEQELPQLGLLSA